MATKIRLQRHGRKKRAFFHIVVADSRSPRDGRYIEKLGTYNPVTNPATIDINVDSSVNWLMNGAQPTDTAKAILSYKGVLYRKHLQVGVNKGAITQEQADAKFAAWVTEKENQVQSKRNRLADEKAGKRSAALKAESARKEAIAAKILAKTSELAAEAEAAAVVETAVEETPVADTVENAAEVAVEEVAETAVVAEPAVEAPAAEETAVEEAVVEAPVAEETAVEEPVAEAQEETPAEETPAAEDNKEENA